MSTLSGIKHTQMFVCFDQEQRAQYSLEYLFVLFFDMK